MQNRIAQSQFRHLAAQSIASMDIAIAILYGPDNVFAMVRFAIAIEFEKGTGVSMLKGNDSRLNIHVK
jgi:hypothetical protein